MNGLGRVGAVLLVSLHLFACTIPLGQAYGDAGQTQDQMDLAVTVCAQEAEMAWEGSFRRQLGAYFIGGTIIGLPFEMWWERIVKRKAWQTCMTRRGFRAEPPP